MRQPDHAAPPTTGKMMAATVGSGASTVGLLAGQLASARAHARSDGKDLAARRPASAQHPPNRQWMGAMACSTAQKSKPAPAAAPSAEQPTIARAHVPKDGWEAAVRLPTRAPPTLWTRPRMEATAVSIAANTAPSVVSPTRALVHATLGGMKAAARPQRRALPPPNRQRTEVTASSTAQHNTAPSAEQPVIARVHAKAATGGAAVRLPARAAPLQT